MVIMVAQSVNMVKPCYVKNNTKILKNYFQKSSYKNFKEWRALVLSEVLRMVLGRGDLLHPVPPSVICRKDLTM